jgi:hypothetical protein
MLLQCAGAAASLVGVWSLAGLSESSRLRGSARVTTALAVGLLGEAAVYFRTPTAARGGLALALLFGTASVLALGVGAAKLDAALADKDGPRVVRRATGTVVGTSLGMAAVGAASLELGASSLAEARVAWSFMFALVAAAVIVFAGRARYATAAVLALGARSLLLALIAVGLLAGARATVAARPLRVALASTNAPAAGPSAKPAGDLLAPAPSALPIEPVPPVATTSASANASPSASATAPSAPVAGSPGELQVEAITARGMLEADARGGVTRRFDRLQACLVDPKNQQHGAIKLKIGIDASGSVAYSKPAGGDLAGTPLGVCLLAVFYKMGFAAPASNNASFDITLRAP